jgi:hypothetical protein
LVDALMQASERLRLSVLETLGAAPTAEPVLTPEDAAADVVDRLAVAHEHELAAGEADLAERLGARFGADVMHQAEALIAVDHVMSADRGAHELARGAGRARLG